MVRALVRLDLYSDRAQENLELEPYDSPAHPLAPWFGAARLSRRAHYASRSTPLSPRRRAIITMVHNEPVFLPTWLRYYSRWFSPEDIYVLDNDSTDGSTERDGFVRIPVEHETVDHTWMVRTIEELQHDLLGRYDVVVVADVDEIIAVAPPRDLGEYLDWFDEEWINPLGYELVHLRSAEPRLRLDQPILAQRRHWFANGNYDKAAVASVPMTWLPGFHNRADHGRNYEPDMRLIHLHRMDYDICRDRHRTRRRKPWAGLDAEQRWALHNRIVEGEEFDRWFDDVSTLESFGWEVKLEEIPAPWRSAF